MAVTIGATAIVGMVTGVIARQLDVYQRLALSRDRNAGAQDALMQHRLGGKCRQDSRRNCALAWLRARVDSPETLS